MWRVFPEPLRTVLGRSILMAIARDPGSAGSESGSVAAALHRGAKEYRMECGNNATALAHTARRHAPQIRA